MMSEINAKAAYELQLEETALEEQRYEQEEFLLRKQGVVLA